MVSGDMFDVLLLSNPFQASYKPEKRTVSYSLFFVADGTFLKFFLKLRVLSSSLEKSISLHDH